MKKTMSNKDVKDLMEKISRYGFELNKKSKYEISGKTIYIDAKPLFFYHGDVVLPTVHHLLVSNPLHRIVIDKGAIPFIAKGADVMRPGIVYIDQAILKDDFIAVFEETHGKPLAVGQALFDSDEMRDKPTGKVVKVIHYVGDDIWSGR